jgi:hypothetical protein
MLSAGDSADIFAQFCEIYSEKNNSDARVGKRSTVQGFGSACLSLSLLLCDPSVESPYETPTF